MSKNNKNNKKHKNNKTITKLPYLVFEGIKGLYRNKVLTATSILVLAACIVVVGVFVILTDVIENNLSKADELYVITAYVSSDFGDETGDKIKEIQKQISSFSNVKDVVYVSKEDALLELKGESEGISDLVDKYGDRLSDYIRARFDISFESYDGLDSLVESVEKIESVETVNTKLDLYHGISRVKSSVATISSALVVLLFFVAVFVTLNTVRIGIYYRRDEISLMRYMGATKAFITSPYIVECFFMGAVAIVLALGAEFCLYNFALKELLVDYGIEGVASFSYFLPRILPTFFGVGVLASSLSGLICVKKYLNV